MHYRPDIIYIYDGTYDGLLTAIFAAYDRREQPAAVTEEENLQYGFDRIVIYIASQKDKALRVQNGLRKTAGDFTEQKIYTAFLSSDPDRATKIYRYVRVAMSAGMKVHYMLANDDVATIEKVNIAVNNEKRRLMGFVRFSELDSGIFYAKFAPEHNQIPLLMPHFVDRFGCQPFILHDERRSTAGVYDMKEWYTVDVSCLNLPQFSGSEMEYRRMWQRFYDTVAIKQRENPRCRMNLMPKKYWRNMFEVDPRRYDSSALPKSLSGKKIDRA